MSLDPSRGGASGLAERIAARAGAAGLALTGEGAVIAARHMLRVLEADPELHLTSIRDPGEFLERHVGESLEGAAMIEPGLAGPLLDLGSGNGYPGIPVAAARPGLTPVLAEASPRKAAFLRAVLEDVFPAGRVIESQIQRASDLAGEPPWAAIVTRAMGNWERVLPRLATRLAPEGILVVWAGESLATIAGRAAWRRYRLVGRRALPGRARSWVWAFGPRPL